MTLASLRDRLAAPLEWIARQIAAWPKTALTTALVTWLVSLIVVAWAF